MAEVRTTRYADGGWCEQEYVDGKLHGKWTSYFADGQKNWEREHWKDRKEGYCRQWDRTGRLIEEQWYHLDVLHGLWRQWNEAGNENVIGDFHFGYAREAFDQTINDDFNQFIKPHYGLEPVQFAGRLDSILPAIRRSTIRLKKHSLGAIDLSQPRSFWSHVNRLGAGEEWPRFKGAPLFPILQINCSETTVPDNPLSDFSFVTLFAVADDVLAKLGEDIVVRAYKRNAKLVSVQPPCEPLDAPSLMSLTETLDSFPDDNDLPPGLRVHLEESGDPQQVLSQPEKLNTRLGGWPGWLQWGRIAHYDKFALQVDSYDVENWRCGDGTIHYFFLHEKRKSFSWVQEMC